MSEPVVIDGKAVAAAVHAETVKEIAGIREKYGTVPGLAVILVGKDPASEVYVRNKESACVKAGMKSDVIRLDATTSTEELLALKGIL